MRRLLIIVVLSMMLVTGCWDKVEIDKRIFVMGIGIDKFEGKQESTPEEELLGHRPGQYLVIYGYPNTGTIAGKGEGEPRFLVSSTGNNVYEVQENLSTRLEGVLNFDHTKVIILGESFAKDEKLVRQVLDAIERSPRIGRRIHLLVTPDTAQEVMNVDIPQQPILGLYIRDLVAKPGRMSRYPDADMGYILRTLHESKATIAPGITASEDGVKVARSAVFKEYKLVGWLGELETKELMFMLDKIYKAEINLSVKELNLSITILGSSTDMKVVEKEGKLLISFDIETEGELRQHAFQVIGQTFDVKYLEEVEKEVEALLERRIIATFKKIQKEYGADVVQAGEYLRKHNPKLWNEVKENWDDVFANMDIQVNMEMKIRRVGVVK